MIILAGGFGERTKGILGGTPKLLIETPDGLTILDHMINDAKSNDLGITIVTNGLFYQQINDYIQKRYPGSGINLVNDEKMTPDSRLGALGDLLFAIDHNEKPEKDVLVMPSDTLFWESFSVDEFLEFSVKHPDSFVTVVYDTGSKDKIKNNLGCVVLDGESNIKEFEEKPVSPKSTLAILAIYMFRPEHIDLLREFKESRGNLNSPSNIIPFLMKKGVKISAFVSRGRVIDANGPEEISQVADYPSTSNQSMGLSSSGSPL